MNSINLGKRIVGLSLSMITALIVTSCSSTSNYREVAQEPSQVELKDDITKIQDSKYPPHRFHSKRFEAYNEKY